MAIAAERSGGGGGGDRGGYVQPGRRFWFAQRELLIVAAAAVVVGPGTAVLFRRGRRRRRRRRVTAAAVVLLQQEPQPARPVTARDLRPGRRAAAVARVFGLGLHVPILVLETAPVRRALVLAPRHFRRRHRRRDRRERLETIDEGTEHRCRRPGPGTWKIAGAPSRNDASDVCGWRTPDEVYGASALYARTTHDGTLHERRRKYYWNPECIVAIMIDNTV